MKNPVFILLGIFFSGLLSAQPSADPNEALPLEANVRTGVLPNGLKYFIRYNAKPEKRAELRLAVNAGSTMENDNQQGLAHFVEHMAFNGTKNFAKNDLVDYLEGIGTKFGPDLNAYTSFDETVYMLQIPTDKEDIYKKGFLILEDWAHNLSFDSLEIEKERGVVTEEWRLGQGAWERMSRKFWPVLFKDSRYADRFPIGKPEILKECSQSLLCDYYRDWYRPDLQAVIVIGDIDVDATEKLVKEQFSKIPASKDPKPLQNWEVPDQEELRISVVSDKESPYNVLQLMYFENSKKTKTYNDYRERLKYQLFNGMISARLTELTKKPDAPILYGGAGYSGSVRNKDAYTCFALFTNENAEAALEAVVTENERVKRFGFTATEFERKKKQILTDMEQAYNERDKTESKKLVNEYVRHFLTGEAVPGIEKEYGYVQALLPGITLEEVNALSGKWIRAKGRNGMIILMMSEKEGVPVPAEETIKAAFLKAEINRDIKAYEDRVISAPLLTAVPLPQKVTKSTARPQGVTEWILGNGAKVLLKPTDFKDDEVLLSAHSWGGYNLYNESDHRSADASNALQEQMGFGNFDAVTLEKYLQDKKASLHTGVGPYSEGLNGKSSRRDVETLMQLVHAYFTMPRYDSSAFKAYIQQQKGFLQNLSSDPGYVFRDSVRYILSGYHPRSAPETEKTLSEVQMKRAWEIYRERYSDPGDFVFTIVGNFNPDTLRPLLEKYIGGISAPVRREKCKDVGQRTPAGTLSRTIEKGNEPRSTVQLVWTGDVAYNRKNRFEAQALCNLLNIKLRENLREEKGAVYGVGIYPQLEHFPKESFQFTCRFSCAPDNVETLISAANDEINDVKKNGCNGVNLGKVKETLLKEREKQLKENNFWLSYISSAEIYNERLEDIELYNKWVSALTSEDFKRIAVHYLREKELKRFVLNPEKTDVR